MNDPVARAEALVRLLLARPSSAAEREQFASLGFDCDCFLIRLICSDEAAERYGDITQHLIDHVTAEAARDTLPHKVAHDLVLAKEEAAALQMQLDRLHGPMTDLLRHEDRIAGLFETLRGIQGSLLGVQDRLERVEGDMLRSGRMHHDR